MRAGGVSDVRRRVSTMRSEESDSERGECDPVSYALSPLAGAEYADENGTFLTSFLLRDDCIHTVAIELVQCVLTICYPHCVYLRSAREPIDGKGKESRVAIQ